MPLLHKKTDASVTDASVTDTSAPSAHNTKFVVRTYAQDLAAAKQKASLSGESDNAPTQRSENSPAIPKPTLSKPLPIPLPPKTPATPTQPSPLTPKSPIAGVVHNATTIQTPAKTVQAVPSPTIVSAQQTPTTHTPPKSPMTTPPVVPSPLFPPLPKAVAPTHTTINVPPPSTPTTPQKPPRSQSRAEVLEQLKRKNMAPEIPANLIIAHLGKTKSGNSVLAKAFTWLTGRSGETKPAQTIIHEDIVVPRGRSSSVPVRKPYKMPPATVMPPAQQIKRGPSISQMTVPPITEPARISPVRISSPRPPIVAPPPILPPQQTATPEPIPQMQSATVQSETPVSVVKPAITVPEQASSRLWRATQNEQQKSHRPSISPLHTYSMDVTDTIKETNPSATSILARQHDTRPISEMSDKKEKHTLMWFAIGGAFLFILSIVGTGYAYVYHAKKVAPATVTQLAPSLIPTNTTAELSGTGSSLLVALAQTAHTPLQNGIIKTVYIATTTKESDGSVEKHPLPGGYLIAALHLPMPTILMNNTAVNSTVGVVGANNQTYPFFILRVASYDSAFAGMLRWEGSLASDMQTLYPPPAIHTVATTTTQKTISANTSLGATKTSSTITRQILPAPVGFVDETVANHAVRVLRNASGQSIMLYGFADKHTLIIARDSAAFTIILTKLNQR